MPEESVLIHGMAEGIGLEKGSFRAAFGKEGGGIAEDGRFPDHESALRAVLDRLSGKAAALKSLSGIGHRVVHGGEKYRSAVLVTDRVAADIEALSEIAPLHNPSNLAGINACRKLFPSA